MFLFIIPTQEIVEFWPNATKVLAPNATLTVFCSAIRDIIWKINGSVVNDWDGRYSSDFNFSEAYSRANGSDIWRYNYTIAMKVLPRNNNTQLECLSPDNSGHLESGGKTTLIVAGAFVGITYIVSCTLCTRRVIKIIYSSCRSPFPHKSLPGNIKFNCPGGVVAKDF